MIQTHSAALKHSLIAIAEITSSRRYGIHTTRWTFLPPSTRSMLRKHSARGLLPCGTATFQSPKSCTPQSSRERMEKIFRRPWKIRFTSGPVPC